MRPSLEDVTEFSTDSFRFEPKIRTRKFVIPFEKNKTEYRQKDIQPMIDSLGSDKITVLNAAIAAFASVEGSEAANKQLQNQRALSIVKAIQANQKDSVTYTITTSENWELFDQQVKTVPQFAVFKGKTHEEVKQLLNDTALNRKLEPWLAKQRHAIVQLTVKQEVSPLTACSWMLEKWNRWMDSCKQYKDARRTVFIDSLWRMQGYYYRALLAGSIDTTCLASMNYPADTAFEKLYYHDAWMKRYLRDTAKANADSMYYKRLMRLVMSFPDHSYFPAVYALDRRWIENWKPDGSYYDNSMNGKLIYSWHQWAQGNAPDSLLAGFDSLETAYHFSMVKVYKSPADKYKRASELFWIYNHFLADTMSDSTALFLADYFTFYRYPELAVSILEPYANRENPNHAILMQYIRFRYVHYEEDTAAANDYYSLLSWAKEILTTGEWCSMFVGPCNISFQVFDHEATRNLYCEECAQHKNYAESPEQWEK